MTKTQSVALYVIALLLIAEFTIAHVRPALVMALNEEEYLAAARNCHEGTSSWQQLREIASQVDSDTASALERSGTVALMECYEKEALRRSLLARGVNDDELGRLELMARGESDAGLRYFVRGITSGK